MKKIIQKIPVKLRWLSLFSVICLVLTGVILIYEHRIQQGLYDQQMAERWAKEGGFSQISAFFAEGAVEDVDYFQGINLSVDKALQEATIVTENENARLWISAVSRRGEAILSSQRATLETEVIGVTGEFFQFHPQKIVTGSLFSEDSMMQDGIVIDEETAWQLFGSSDVAGMQVMIGQVPHFITGVIDRPKGRMNEAAGLKKSVCYLSMDSLENYGSATGGFTYELVMPNPIKGFALSSMQKIFGVENEEVVVLENSTRYRWISLLNVVKNFGIRSMSVQGIVYPYWENLARGYEDILACTLLMKVVLLWIPCIFIIICIIRLWKKKTWTLNQGITWLQEQLYEAGARRAQKKKKQEEME